jgi:hypothetical protein
MPQYVALLYGLATGETDADEWDEEEMAEYNAFEEAAGAAGVMDGGAALHPTSTARTVFVRGGKGGEVVTTDGPFAETKEILGGYYLLTCQDLDEAMRWAAQIPTSWRDGKVEVRPVVEFDEG